MHDELASRLATDDTWGNRLGRRLFRRTFARGYRLGYSYALVDQTQDTNALVELLKEHHRKNKVIAQILAMPTPELDKHLVPEHTPPILRRLLEQLKARFTNQEKN